MKMKRFSAIILFALAGLQGLQAQTLKTFSNKENSNYKFTVIKNLDATPVEDQSRSGTCWSFSALSFFESELLRMGKGQVNLSEMFVVRNAYLDKAEKYVRMYGNFQFGPGGAFHDIPYVINKYGIVPEEVYKGLNYGTEKHNHKEMDAVLEGMMHTYAKQKPISTAWKNAFEGTLDAYLGDVPKEFTYQGKKYTPKTYAATLGLNMNEYVALTSFTHHPFYSDFILEVPDNWVMGKMYNVPLDEMMETLDNALTNGFTVAWAADVSEKGFSFRDGLAIVPENDSLITKKGEDNKNFSDAGAMKFSTAFETPMKEKVINQQVRQDAFDRLETTDDHGMHITGIIKDQNGTKYYIVKNSWGLSHNQCDGYFYASESYVRYKTINLLVHKDALPKKVSKNLELEKRLDFQKKIEKKQ